MPLFRRRTCHDHALYTQDNFFSFRRLIAFRVMNYRRNDSLRIAKYQKAGQQAWRNLSPRRKWAQHRDVYESSSLPPNTFMIGKAVSGHSWSHITVEKDHRTLSCLDISFTKAQGKGTVLAVKHRLTLSHTKSAGDDAIFRNQR